MKTIRIITALVTASALISCEMERIPEPSAETERPVMKTAYMRLEASAPSYGTAAKADASEGVWADGSKVYLQFSVGESLVSGSATYNLLEDIWALEYAGTLTTVESASCEAYYFENAGEVTFEEVQMTEKTAVYMDKSATYTFSYEDNLIVLKAHLKPYLSRVRLEGTAGQVYHFDGPMHYTCYNMLKNEFTSSSQIITDTIPESGRSNYYYLYFADAAERKIYFYDYGNGDKFTRTFPDNVFAMGKSGYLNVPTAEGHSGFVAEKLQYVDIAVSGKAMRMIYIESGTFSMGATTNTSEQPIHEVTISKPYFIGETEVTQELWLAVMGKNPSSFSGVKRPVESVSWNDCQTFISKLNAELKATTGLTFRLPTEAEWEFAAKGGNKSEGYTYSGSNTASDVAWYGRSSTQGTSEVKKKQPNELGIYDMSGNVYEWCADLYGSYSSGAQTDPTGPSTGSNRVNRGGSWYNNSASYCRCAYRYNYAPTYTSYRLGLRLASH